MLTLYHFTMGSSLDSIMRSGITPGPMLPSPVTAYMGCCELEAMGVWLWPCVSAEIVKDFLHFKQAAGRGHSGALLECRVRRHDLLSHIYELEHFPDRLRLEHSLSSTASNVTEERRLKVQEHHQLLPFDICVETIPPSSLRIVATVEVVVSACDGFEFNEKEDAK